MPVIQDLPVKDGNGALQRLKSTISGSGVDQAYIPHHIIQHVSGSVVVTSSVPNPVFVSSSGGTFKVTSSFEEPVAVDLLPGKVVIVTSSVEYPIFVSGTLQTSTSATFNGKTFTIQLIGTGSTANIAHVDDNNRLFITGAVTATSSLENPLGVTASLTNPLGVTASLNNPLGVTSSVQNPLAVTASLTNRLGVTGSVELLGTSYVTSSVENPVYISGTLSTSTNSTYSGKMMPIQIIGTGSTANIAQIDSNNRLFVTGAVTVTSSLQNRLGITGSVELLGTSYVTSSYENPVAVTASLNNRLGVTGSVEVLGVATVTASLTNRLGVTGSVALLGTSPVTSSLINPLGVTGSVALLGTSLVTASLANPLGVTGSVALLGTSTVTASLTNRVGITGSVETSLSANQTLATLTSITNPVTVTSSNVNPIITQVGTGSGATMLNPLAAFNGATWWANSQSGTFALTSSDPARKELIIHNPGPGNLFISVAGTNQNAASKFGFTLVSSASSPSLYSFIIYPSGTYISSEPSRALFYGGFYASSSAEPPSAVLVTSVT